MARSHHGRHSLFTCISHASLSAIFRDMSTFPRHICVLLLLSAPATASAQSGDLSGFGFLRVEPSARAAALGGSLAAVYGDDVNAFFYNPALLNESMHRNLSLSYLNHLSDISAGIVAYSRHFGQLGAVAAGLRFMHWGRFDRVDESGEKAGSFGASDVALTLGMAQSRHDGLRYGANVHVVYSGIASYSATALLADIGVVYHLPRQLLTLSASVNNAGITLSSLGPTRDTIPIDLRAGVTKRLRHVPLLLSFTAYNLHDIGGSSSSGNVLSEVFQHAIFGAEFQVIKAFHLRFGYNHRRHMGLKTSSRLDLAGVGLGFGFQITRFRLDYAYNSWSFAGLHQFTVGTKL